MKCIVKPSTSIMMVLDHNEVVYSNRPSVVTYTAFIQSRVASGQLLLVAPNVPALATDDQFKSFWKESDKDEALAVESFLAAVKEPEEVPEPTPAPTPIPTPEPTPAPTPAPKKK